MPRGDTVPHKVRPSGTAGLPLRSVHGRVVEHVHNYKSGSTSLTDYFECEYGGDEVVADESFRVSAFAVRDPVSRFASAVTELLRRFVLNACVREWCQGFDRESARKGTRWFRLLTSMNYTVTTAAERAALMRAFVYDVECCRPAFSMDHFQPQAAFATYASRGIDLLIPLDRPDAALADVASRVGVARSCRLHTANTAGDALPQGDTAGDDVWLRERANALPSASALRAALTPDLVRRICDLYLQDYLCFELAPPPECEGHIAHLRRDGDR